MNGKKKKLDFFSHAQKNVSSSLTLAYYIARPGILQFGSLDIYGLKFLKRIKNSSSMGFEDLK